MSIIVDFATTIKLRMCPIDVIKNNLPAVTEKFPALRISK